MCPQEFCGASLAGCLGEVHRDIASSGFSGGAVMSTVECFGDGSGEGESGTLLLRLVSGDRTKSPALMRSSGRSTIERGCKGDHFVRLA